MCVCVCVCVCYFIDLKVIDLFSLAPYKYYFLAVSQVVKVLNN